MPRNAVFESALVKQETIDTLKGQLRDLVERDIPIVEAFDLNKAMYILNNNRKHNSKEKKLETLKFNVSIRETMLNQFFRVGNNQSTRSVSSQLGNLYVNGNRITGFEQREAFLNRFKKWSMFPRITEDLGYMLCNMFSQALGFVCGQTIPESQAVNIDDTTQTIKTCTRTITIQKNTINGGLAALDYYVVASYQCFPATNTLILSIKKVSARSYNSEQVISEQFGEWEKYRNLTIGSISRERIKDSIKQFQESNSKQSGWSYKIVTGDADTPYIFGRYHKSIWVKRGVSTAFTIAVGGSIQGNMTFKHRSARIEAPDSMHKHISWEQFYNRGDWKTMNETQHRLLKYIIGHMKIGVQAKHHMLLQLPQNINFLTLTYDPDKHMSCKAFACLFQSDPQRLLNIFRKTLLNEEKVSPNIAAKLLRLTANTREPHNINLNTNHEERVRNAIKSGRLSRNNTSDKLLNNHIALSGTDDNIQFQLLSKTRNFSSCRDTMQKLKSVPNTSAKQNYTKKVVSECTAPALRELADSLLKGNGIIPDY